MAKRQDPSSDGGFAAANGWDRDYEVYSDFDLPTYVGPTTFMNLPWITDPAALLARRTDVAIIGAPFDDAVSHRSGARFGPRAIREALRAPYVVQERVKPARTVFPLMNYGHLEFKEMQVDVQPQAFLGKVAGCSSYVSSSGPGSYSPASGFAPTFIIDTKS